jgi:hypothetical protein
MNTEFTAGEIVFLRQGLENELRKTLASMEYSLKLPQLRKELEQLKTICPHQADGINFALKDRCPFCKKKFDHNKE